MTFHEKSAWACLVAIVMVFAPYFLFAFSNSSGLPVFVDAILVLGVTLILTVILAVVHVVFALTSARIRRSGSVPAPDEREIVIELRSAKIAAVFLSAVVLLWCLTAYVGIPISSIRSIGASYRESQDASLSDFVVPSSDVLFFVHLLFAGFVLANVAYYGAMIVGYRRSA